MGVVTLWLPAPEREPEREEERPWSLLPARLGHCAYCGLGDHESDGHGAISRAWPRKGEPPFAFRAPEETCFPVAVELTDEEMERAFDRAVEVNAVDRKRGWKMYFKPEGESTQDVHVRGFAAEIAASRATGLKLNWDMLPANYKRRDKPADIGLRTEVRNAKSKDGRLWASLNDPPNRAFVLMTGTGPAFTFRGWISGRDLFQPRLWRDPPAVRYSGYFMDGCDLNPLPMPPEA